MSTEQGYLTTTRIITKGQIDVPDEYTEDLHLEPGTKVTLLRLGEGLLVIPESPALTRLSRTVREAMKRSRTTRQKVLDGLGKSRQAVYQGRYGDRKSRRE